MKLRAQSEPVPQRSLLIDGALAAGLAAFITVGTWFASQNQPARRAFDV